MALTATFLPPGEGPHYDWDNDQPFVKVSGTQTGGAYTLIEDNLKPGFALGLHRHDHHAETFYILEGAYIDASLNGPVAERMRSQLVPLPGQGHWWMIENPTPAADALARFWAGLG